MRISGITLVGAGAVATSLLSHLRDRTSFRIDAVISRSGTTAEILAAQYAIAAYGSSIDAMPHSSNLILLCVPDDQIKGVSDDLANSRGDLNNRTIAHFSGARDSTLLGACSRKGAWIGSLHPLQTFPRHAKVPAALEGTYCTIEGDNAAARILSVLATALGMHPLAIETDQKVLYHLGAVFASNYVVTLLSIADELLSAAGITGVAPLEAIRPLIESTVRNTLIAGTSGALTGPVRRGDTETLDAHVNAIARLQPQLSSLYRILALETIRLTEKEGLLKESIRRDLRSIFGPDPPQTRTS